MLSLWFIKLRWRFYKLMLQLAIHSWMCGLLFSPIAKGNGEINIYLKNRCFAHKIAGAASTQIQVSNVYLPIVDVSCGGVCVKENMHAPGIVFQKKRIGTHNYILIALRGLR